VLTYDAWNWLVQVTLPNEDHVQANRYDGLGRRIRREDIDLPYDYYYNEAWQLLEERRDGDEDPLAQYVWHPYYIDALAVRYWDGNTDGTYDYFGASEGEQYYLHDANFNVTTLLDRGGDLLERYNYTPYGEVTFLNHNFSVATTQASVLGNTHFYTGRERDPETGLQLNRHRYYASHLGRWLTRDPIGYDANTASLYEYTSSMPPSAFDPSGLLAVCCRPQRKVRGVEFIDHCQLRNACVPGEVSYPAWPDTDSRRKMDNGKSCNAATKKDIEACLRRNAHTNRPNCQGNTRDRIGKCCLNSNWPGPQLGTGHARGECTESLIVHPQGPGVASRMCLQRELPEWRDSRPPIPLPPSPPTVSPRDDYTHGGWSETGPAPPGVVYPPGETWPPGGAPEVE